MIVLIKSNEFNVPHFAFFDGQTSHALFASTAGSGGASWIKVAYTVDYLVAGDVRMLSLIHI